MTEMVSWVIVALSAAAATLATFLFQTGGFPPLDQLPGFVLRRWPSFAVPWLTVYGTAALVSSSVIAFNSRRNVPLRQNGRDWARDYLGRLAAAQYFTSLVLLLAICFAKLESGSDTFSFLVPAGEISLALLSCAAVALLGLVAWVFLSAGVLMRLTATNQAAQDGPDITALREFIDIFRKHPPAGAAEISAIMDLLQQQRSIIKETTEEVKAATRLGRTIHENVNILLSQQSDHRGETWATAQSAIESSTAELRAVAAKLDESLAQVWDLAGSPATQEALGPRVTKPQISRSQLSQELKSLLEQISLPGRSK